MLRAMRGQVQDTGLRGESLSVFVSEWLQIYWDRWLMEFVKSFI